MSLQVAEGSYAENAGLQVDDVIVRINEDSTAALTHADAHDVFQAAGSDFRVAVRRDDEIDIPDEEQNNEEINNIMESSLQGHSIESQQVTVNMSKTDESIQSSSKLRVTDEQIAEAISGETELLPDQNVLGVNFNKVDLTESTVLKVINEQTTKTEVDFHDKKWSTFLQKPNTPKLIPKKKEPQGPTAPPYRVIIKKQTKKAAEVRSKEVVASPLLESEESNEIDIQEEQELCDEYERDIDQSQDDETELQQEVVEETLEEEIMDEDASNYGDEQIDVCGSPEEKLPETTITESQVTLEEQLAQVQQQLQALSQLPSAIQVSLDAVTQQLAKIVKSTHKDEQAIEEESVMIEDENAEVLEGEVLEEENDEQPDSDIAKSETLDDDQMYQELNDISEIGEQDYQDCAIEEEQEAEEIENEKIIQQERKLIQMEESHQRRLDQRPTHPLTPLQRPIILPGGRRWSQPNDALPVPKKTRMSDEKISATIENYSEVITGRTKGLTNGILFGHGPIQQNLFTEITKFRTCNISLRNQIDKRYLENYPPPKNLDYLQQSEVFRLVHDMDPPVRGIAARSGKIVSEEDYYSEKTYESDEHTSVAV